MGAIFGREGISVAMTVCHWNLVQRAGVDNVMCYFVATSVRRLGVGRCLCSDVIVAD